jgi:uncharacterized RDD family membrane protein YckC
VSFEALPPFSGEGEGRDGGVAPRTYASWGLRALAWIIDGLIVAVVSFLIATVIGVHNIFVLARPHGSHRVTRDGGLVAWQLIDGVLIFVYATWLLASKWRATLGMRLVKIHVEDGGGRPLTVGRLAGRAGIVLGAGIVSSLFPPLLLVILIDLLWPLWDSQRQTLHDKIVGTVVRTGTAS